MGYTADGMVLWPLLPNWKSGVSEALEFRTRILGPTLTGARQKRRMRIAPRRSFGFEVHPHHDSRRLLDNIRFSQTGREWALPIWHDRQKIAADLGAGSTSIPCATSGYDFADGRYAVLRRQGVFSDSFEIVQVDSVEPDAITLATATANDWSAGSYLFPIRTARLAENSNAASLLNGEVSTLSVSMEVTEPCDWPAYDFPDVYRGWPVWEFDTDWRQARNFGFDRIIAKVDNDTSIPSHFDFSGKTFSTMDVLWWAKGRAQHSLVRSVLYALLGRYKSLWVPTYTNDLEMVATIGSSSTALVVRKCGYTLFALGEEGRKDVRIELKNGTVFYRRIILSGEVGDTEQLTLSSSLGVSVSPSSVRRISFLMLMQQASDSVALTHLTDADGAMTLPIVLEGVIEPPED